MISITRLYIIRRHKETYYYGMNDSTSLFESAGNVFLGYMETPGSENRKIVTASPPSELLHKIIVRRMCDGQQN